MFLKNRNISSKIKISKVTDYAALKKDITAWQRESLKDLIRTFSRKENSSYLNRDRNNENETY